MKTHALPVPAPEVTPETKPFWDGVAEGRLLFPRCEDCGKAVWYPRAFCPSCGGRNVAWTEASGRGFIYSFTVIRKGSGLYQDAAPYVVAYVELIEGPRVYTNIVDCDLATITIGQAVRVVFERTDSGAALPRFAPLAQSAAKLSSVSPGK